MALLVQKFYVSGYFKTRKKIFYCGFPHQNRVKRVKELISDGIFGQKSKMKTLVFKFLKRSNFDGLFRPSPLKTDLKKNHGEAMGMKRNRLIPFLIWVMGR